MKALDEAISSCDKLTEEQEEEEIQKIFDDMLKTVDKVEAIKKQIQTKANKAKKFEFGYNCVSVSEGIIRALDDAITEAYYLVKVNR